MGSRENEPYQFENSIADCFQCAICLTQLEEPMQCVYREHSFCKDCITRHLQVNNQSCPTCNDPLTLASLRPARLIANLLSQLITPCLYVERGCCTEKMRREMMQAHVRNCGFCPVPCSNVGCDEILNRKDQAEHESNECDFRKEKCEVCQQDVPHGDGKFHCRYVRKEEVDEMKNRWEFQMACAESKLEKSQQDFVIRLQDMTTQMNAMKVQTDSRISELERNFALSTSDTTMTINEMNTDIRGIKCFVNAMQDRTNVVNGEIGDIRSDMDRFRNQLGAIRDRVDGTECQINEVQSTYQSGDEKRLSEIHSLRQFLVRVEQNVNMKQNIVIAGGQNSKHELDSVEMFSWENRKWSSLNKMLHPRLAASSLVYKGQMVISGGVSDDADGFGMESIRFSDGLCAQWRNFPSKFPQQYRRHKCLVYAESCVFVIGGRFRKTCNGVLKMSVAIPPPCDLELVCSMPEPRQGHGAELYGDSIVIVGGTSGVSRRCLDSVLLYDIKANTCEALAPLSFAISSMATVLWKDNVILIGGRDDNNVEKREVAMYNITNETCTMLPPMKHQRSGCTAVIQGDVIVVMGGKNKDDGCLNTVEMFSFDRYHWQDLPAMDERRWYASAAVVRTDK